MPKIEHVALWTHHLEILKTFYLSYFGGIATDKYTNPATGFQSYFICFDEGSRLEIMQLDTIPPNRHSTDEQYTGFIHIAFAVGSREQVDDLTARLRNDGFRVLQEPRTTGDGYYESVVLDPDGNRVEITV